MRENLTQLQKKALDVIAGHGIKNPITGKEIATSIGLTPRATGKEGADMRSIINALRVKGWPICAKGDGYYFARNNEELSAFISDFQGRIDKQQQAVNGLKAGSDKLHYGEGSQNWPEGVEVQLKDIREVTSYPSERFTDVTYEVAVVGSLMTCTCPAFRFKHDCKHLEMKRKEIIDKSQSKLL